MALEVEVISPPTKLRVLIAPFEFKGTYAPSAIAKAMQIGLEIPGVTTTICPLSDGGGGFVDALSAKHQLKKIERFARDPLRRWRKCALLFDSSERLAVIEGAMASGLWRLSETERSPWTTSSEGIGDLIKAALDIGARRIVLGLGGTATLDGGIGAARSLGFDFVDQRGVTVPPGAAGLALVKRIIHDRADARIRTATIEVAADVTNPICGVDGIARVYGLQKGAQKGELPILDRHLGHFFSIVFSDSKTGADSVVGGGAGGCSANLLFALAGAKIHSGFQLVRKSIGLDDHLRRCDIALTGEGCFDNQARFGKGPAAVAQLASELRIPTIAICAKVGTDWQNAYWGGELAGLFSITRRASSGQIVTLDDITQRTREVFSMLGKAPSMLTSQPSQQRRLRLAEPQFDIRKLRDSLPLRHGEAMRSLRRSDLRAATRSMSKS